jgi:ATP adenylyltransferase
MEYIRAEKSDGCIFCAAPAAGDDEAMFIIHRGEGCYVMLNRYPYTSGHLMVCPYRHTGTIEDLDEHQLLEMMILARTSLKALRAAYSPEGFNLGLNLGKVAGAGFDEHVHLHVVPRWGADSNFMPVIGDARVLPETLADTYRAVTAVWA